MAGCLVLALHVGHAQRKPATNAPVDIRAIMVEKAHALEARGRPDMAIQSWQQILLSDPNSAEALAGLARDYKLIGSADKSNDALGRLRRVNPNDPNIPKIEAMTSTRVQSDQLRQAGELARQGKSEDAMRVYRSLYGDRPPDGDIALAYYETLYGTAAGKQQAIAAMRALEQRNPGDPRYAIQLGVMLTYEGKTRAEGMRILRGYPNDPNAQSALRQALIWDAANPASAEELREYLRQHPKDTEISADLQEDELQLARMNTGIARTAAERAAFAALNAKKLEDAQARFYAILQKEPNNARAAAGLGFLRMQQKNFAGAISYLTQAQQNGFKDRSVDDALATSRFWFTMGEASQAFDDNRLDDAAARYKSALAMRPRSPEALIGLADLLIKQEQFSSAAEICQQLLQIQPGNVDASRGLFLAYARQSQDQKALALAANSSEAVKTALAKDPEYLRTLVAIYQLENRDADAQRVLALALALPFPDNGTTFKPETKLQYAGILTEAKRFDQAAALYSQVLNDDAGNLSAWMGLIGAHHELGQDTQAIADVEKMPPAVYESALADSGFLSMLAGVYQQASQFETAQDFLERSVRMQIAAGRQPGIALQLQLAAIYLQRNNAAQANGIYRQVLLAHPERADAWKGLISTLQATNRNAEAVQEIALLPPRVRRELDADIEFLQSEASLYAAGGDFPRAIEYMNRVQAHYNALRTQPPASIDIQNAWLLFNTRNDRALYPALMRLGGRQDLTAPQRETVQNIWGNWSVRRAAAAKENGNGQRALDILDASSQAFPDNLTVRKAVAGGYLTIGHARESLALFKTVPLQDGTSSDFQGAIGAAMAANDMAQAESWLRQALDLFPSDAAILGLAARFEQARGDNQRAADYWKAALAAMPRASATDKLAHELAYPEQARGARRASTTDDLQRLLNPDYEPFQKTVKLPPLPAYGPDPYASPAPMAKNEPPTSPLANQQPSWSNVPTTTVVPFTAASSQPLSRSNSGQVAGSVTPGAAPADSSVPPLSSAPGQQNPTVDLQPTLPPPDTGSVSGSVPAPIHLQRMSAEVPGGQSTEDSGIAVHPLANAPVPVEAPVSAAPPQNTAIPGSEYTLAQYTPSAQEAAAAAGAKPQPASQSEPAAQPVAKPKAGHTTELPPPPIQKSKKASKAAAETQAQPQTQTVPTLITAPGTELTLQQSPQQTPQPQIPAMLQQQVPFAPQAPAPTPASATGLTDQQLQDQSLPPLRGPWVRVERQQPANTPQEEAESQLQAIQSGYSPWFGGTGTINYRSGGLGYDHLSALDAPFEASEPLGFNGRLTVIAKPVFLDSGQADGTSVITVQESTTAGNTLVTIPQPIGTLAPTASTPPAQQNAVGVGGEVQLAFPHLALAGGYTPAGFLVSTFTGRAQWKPNNGPFTFNFSRDPVKDTQLSYAGLRDPAGNSLGTVGQIWGAVTASQGNVQFAHGDAESGFYLGASGQYLAGYQVETNNRIDGSGGAYWRVLTSPDYGSLSIGANFFGMHYAHNEQAFTFGMGGYFSPQAYFLANVPFTWNGHSGTRWHYNVLGSLGVQAFQEDSAPLFPLAAQAASEIALNNAALPAKTSVGPNYDLRTQTAYAITPNWFAGGFLSANNSRNYSTVSAGFYVRFLFHPQPSRVVGPTGLFPTDGLRPFQVP